MSYRRPLKTLPKEQESFEPQYTLELIRKWKLDKIKSVMKQGKK